MKKLIVILFAFASLCIASAQNLVYNSSFESNNGLPTGLDQFSNCNRWSNAGSLLTAPDYYNVDGSLLADLPVTSVAEVSPLSGKSVMGIIACGKEGSNEREYISISLRQPLVVGEKYKLTFNVTNGKTYGHSFTGFGVSDLGVLFSHSQIDQIGKNPIQETPQFKLASEFFSRNWEEVTYAFTATDDFDHLTIGVFGADLGKSFSFHEGNSALAELTYYFFDDVSLVEDKVVAEGTRKGDSSDNEIEDAIYLPNAFTPDGDNQNDVFEVVSALKGKFIGLRIFDRWGDEIFYSKDINISWDGRCSGSPCPVDLYVWQVKYYSTNLEGEEIVKEQTGTVHLIR